MTHNKYDLDTPCLVLDLDLLDENLRLMQAAASKAGKNLRPHAKTHKCSALAKMQIEAGALGVCAAKVSEAEVLARAGIGGVLVTGPVSTPAKARRLVEVLQISPDLMTAVDSCEGVELLCAALRDRGMKMDVLLDLDAGLRRTGAKPDFALDLAAIILSKPELRLRGIQAYAGQVQHIASFGERETASQQCLQEPAAVFRGLRGMTESCTIFSASGTGTSAIDLALPELTEMQVGSYTLMDAEYLAIGSADDPVRFSTFAPALRLLTTVVSANQDGFVTVDAGLKALYRDGGTPQVLGPGHSGLVYNWFGDEYGRLTCQQGAALPELGTVYELVTSHCDPTVNLFERYFLTRGDEVVGEWVIDLRGCSQ